MATTGSVIDPGNPTRPRNRKVALLQRAIAHYRFPLFKKLTEDSTFDWTFYCGCNDIGTGLVSTEIHQLKTRPIRVYNLFGPVQYHAGVTLREFNALLLDLGWALLSNPRYLLEARLRGIATIGWSKGIPQNPEKKEGSSKGMYQRLIVGMCDTIVAYGEISRQFLVRLGFPEQRIFVAQNTIDTVRIADETPVSLEQKQSLAAGFGTGDRFIFGYLGSLIPRKRVESIIEAYNICRKRGADAVLIIAGGGSSEAKVRTAAEASPFARDIHFAGRVPAGKEGGYFQLFDAYLSFAEGGVGVLEAMANGRTVVSTPEKYPETELLMDGENALLASDRTVEAFADRMHSALTHRKSLLAIGESARKCVLHEATLERMVAAITSAVTAAIARRRASRT